MMALIGGILVWAGAAVALLWWGVNSMAMAEEENGGGEDRPLFRVGLGTRGASPELERRVAEARARLDDENGGDDPGSEDVAGDQADA